MSGRNGIILFLFSVCVQLCSHWHLAKLDMIPREWDQSVGLIGALGFSVVLISLPRLTARGLWALQRARAETLATESAKTEASPQPPMILPSDEIEVQRLSESGLVDADWYIDTYPDVGAEGFNACFHYFHHGAAEGRNPNRFFDTNWYLENYSDVREAGINPLVHYIDGGASEGRATGPDFDTAFYLGEYEDVRTSGINPLLHFLTDGRFEGRRPLAPS